MNGKGSSRRPTLVPRATLEDNWRQAFSPTPYKRPGPPPRPRVQRPVPSKFGQ